MKNIKTILCILTIVCLASCNNSEKAIRLTIRNNELYFAASKDSLFYQNNQRHYKTKKQRGESLNVLKYTLTNSTDKKVLFLANGINLIDIYGLNTVVKKNSVSLIASRPLSDFGMEMIDSCSFCKSSLISQQERDENIKLRLLGAKKNVALFKSFLMQSVILEPNETREFSALVSLPFMQESDPTILQNHYSYDLRPNNSYTFSLSYEINKSELLKELTAEQIDELKKNNIEIFDGKILSNEIKLVSKF